MTLPSHFFRTRDNGATVFRVTEDPTRQRLDLDQIAVVNLNNGQIKPQTDLTPADHTAITDWMTTRQSDLAARHLDDIRRTVDTLNQTAHWAQTKATDAELSEITDALLLSMHDLRQVLIRKQADRASAD